MSYLTFLRLALETKTVDNESVNPSIVTQSPDMLSGAPVFRGTRVPVQTLIDSLKAGESIDDFLQGFPTVTREQICAFLDLAQSDAREAIS
ncbi:MAG: DUF433 domain-containing protein [Planctomycetes bacterium]|nr:DUF433 domain-containing protein [Planctomycetota bacterium]